jgi:U3 small nucleolar RNA-associated protein 7
VDHQPDGPVDRNWYEIDELISLRSIFISSPKCIDLEMSSEKQRKDKTPKSHKKKHELDLSLPESKYARGALDVKVKTPKSRIAKANSERVKEQIVDAARHTSAAEILLPSDPGGIEMDDKSKRIYKLKHQEIVQNVDINTSRNAFNFQLQEFGPYSVNYSRNGRYRPSRILVHTDPIILCLTR